jgi:hypothetical protein
MTSSINPTLFRQAIAAEEAHCRRLAATPGWQGYIKDKAERMAKWQPAMYGHLPQLVADAIREQPPHQPKEKTNVV